jgi:hypothetical protein
VSLLSLKCLEIWLASFPMRVIKLLEGCSLFFIYFHTPFWTKMCGILFIGPSYISFFIELRGDQNSIFPIVALQKGPSVHFLLGAWKKNLICAW